MPEDIRIEQLHEQLIEVGVDKPGLGEQLLRSGLVVRLGGGREVRIDEDALAVAVAAARMDRQSFEPQEDLDLVLGDLDAHLLVPMDVRRAVIVALDVHVTVRVQGGVLPVRALEVPDGKRLEGDFFDCLKALAPRDSEASVATRVDALHALPERLVDLGERGEARTSVAEARIAHQDFHFPSTMALSLG